MNREYVANFIYHRVMLTDIDDRTYVGWLVPAQYDNKAYEILPLSFNTDTYVFKISHIKKLKHYDNGFSKGE